MKITLNDIAKQVGVTPSTVQRALSGAAGVSGRKRDEITRVAAQMGYRRAAEIPAGRPGPFRLAVVLPDTQSTNRYYSSYAWEGVEQCLEKCAVPQLEVVRLTYKRSPEDHCIKLRALLGERFDQLDGVLTRGSIFPEVVRALEELHARGVPVVLVGTDTRQELRICCVRSFEEMAGRMAADLLLEFGALQSGGRVIVCGNFTGINQYNSSQGFERELWESNLQPDVMKIISDIDPLTVKNGVLRVLDSGLQVQAIYSCSARGTLPVCDAVREAGLVGKIRLIGSDLFPESAALLREGVLSAIIHNRPAVLTARAMQVLIDYVSGTNLHPPDHLVNDALIVTRGNLPYYMGEPGEDPQIAMPGALSR